MRVPVTLQLSIIYISLAFCPSLSLSITYHAHLSTCLCLHAYGTAHLQDKKGLWVACESLTTIVAVWLVTHTARCANFILLYQWLWRGSELGLSRFVPWIQSSQFLRPLTFTQFYTLPNSSSPSVRTAVLRWSQPSRTVHLPLQRQTCPFLQTRNSVCMYACLCVS